MGPTPRPWTKERLFSRAVVKDTGCIEWTGATGDHGYGQIRTAGKIIGTHRLSWLLHFGDPTGFDVCHRCDNPPCINPEHLFLGSEYDNVIDMRDKGRHGTAKINQASADAIRAELATTSQAEVAEKYGISQAQVSDIKLGRCWGRVPRKEITRKSHLDADSIRAIRARCDAGEQFTAIARDYSITRYQVSNIGRRKQWKNVPE